MDWHQDLPNMTSRVLALLSGRQLLAFAVKEAAWGLARYAAISQDNGLVPIVEPEILLDGDHPIERTLEVIEKAWSEVFFYLVENNVIFEGTPGADHKEKASPETIAKFTLTMLKGRVPPAVPGITNK